MRMKSLASRSKEAVNLMHVGEPHSRWTMMTDVMGPWVYPKLNPYDTRIAAPLRGSTRAIILMKYRETPSD
jgi:hypothetical protein